MAGDIELRQPARGQLGFKCTMRVKPESLSSSATLPLIIHESWYGCGGCTSMAQDRRIMCCHAECTNVSVMYGSRLGGYPVQHAAVYFYWCKIAVTW